MTRCEHSNYHYICECDNIGANRDEDYFCGCIMDQCEENCECFESNYI